MVESTTVGCIVNPPRIWTASEIASRSRGAMAEGSRGTDTSASAYWMYHDARLAGCIVNPLEAWPVESRHHHRTVRAPRNVEGTAAQEAPASSLGLPAERPALMLPLCPALPLHRSSISQEAAQTMVSPAHQRSTQTHGQRMASPCLTHGQPMPYACPAHALRMPKAVDPHRKSPTHGIRVLKARPMNVQTHA